MWVHVLAYHPLVAALHSPSRTQSRFVRHAEDSFQAHARPNRTQPDVTVCLPSSSILMLLGRH